MKLGQKEVKTVTPKAGILLDLARLIQSPNASITKLGTIPQMANGLPPIVPSVTLLNE